MSCKWVASDQPRVIGGRHLDDCEQDGCKGCQPCLEPHCRVCGIEHAACCAGCKDEARTNLAEILRMCDDLPEEVEHRGVDSEAMNLLGPVADHEAWGHRQASAKVGRIDRGWLDTATDERHPLIVLAGWEDVWRDALEHEGDGPATVARAAAYLDTQLTYMAGYEDVPFEDFAKDLRGCVSHMENVLSDGVRPETTRVTCTNEHCRKRPRLEIAYGETAMQDRWRCPACVQTYDRAAYLDAHAKQLRHAGSQRFVRQAEAVATLETQGRSRRTVRKWLAPPKDAEDASEVTVVLGYCEVATHAVWLWWPDLWALHNVTQKRTTREAA